MIPKIIHYCWFGGNPLPPFAIRCIESWKKYCPDYEIKQWNESNFDINYNVYVREAYEAKKWAFVSDIARLAAIYNHGGIYLDTDVEVIRPLDSLLTHDMFMGFEHTGEVNTGIGFGAVKEFPILQKMIDIYALESFIKPDGTHNVTTCNIYTKMVLREEGFKFNNEYQNINGIAIYPAEYFAPKRYAVSENTYSIHYYALSWKDENRNANRTKMRLMSMFGPQAGSFIANGLQVYNTFGFRGVWRKIRGKNWQVNELK
ncbi:MAG: glycosyl transferase [Treponema sp.]|nr:glycosyl transferase [Treponema sp.]